MSKSDVIIHQGRASDAEIQDLVDQFKRLVELCEADPNNVSFLIIKREKDAPYHSTDDRIYGTKYVYCSQHLRVHMTGWCTVSCLTKSPCSRRPKKALMLNGA